MKKEIVINASKDRSRIAIVEDGELVELYVEHPDNVRTLGNIYLGRIRKIMPAIKAAFVDVGQKQDAFLHFSDLTENLPALLALAGEKVPGYEAGLPLAHAPQKRVADDESEPDIEEKLEFDTGEEPQPRRRSRSRSRGGRPRGRREEEEEQEEQSGEQDGGRPPRASPFVIDLTLKRGKVEPPSAPTPTATSPDDRPTNDATPTKPPRRSSGRKKRTAAEPAPPEPAPAAPETVPEASASEEPPLVARRRGRSGPDEPQPETAAAVADEAPLTAEAETSAEPRRRGRRGGRRRSRSKEETAAGAAAEGGADETEGAEAPDAETVAEAPGAPAEAPSEREAPPSAPGRPTRERGDRRGRQRRSRADGEAPPAEASPEPETAKGRPAARATPEPAPPSESKGAQREGKRPEPKREPQARASAWPFRPEEILRRDGRIPVKITKEPISAKGSRVSTDISLAGRFLVLVPAADYVAVSKKIESARERRRLKTLATSLKPEGCGVIVRTVAEGRDAKTLDTDFQLLLEKWRKIEKQLAARPEPPQLLYEDVNMVSSIIRDLFTEDYDRILVDDPRLHKNVKAYVQAVAPHMADRVQLHRSNAPVFRAAGLEGAVEQVFSTRVPLRSGGYLFVEHTEAMHVIDVNSGRAGRGKTQAENLLSVNLEAAREVAKQLRLRDLGGIIVVDFIDMRSEADRRKVYQALKDAFKRDRAVTKLLPMSDFGLIEITRQRLRPSITAQGHNGDGEALDAAAAMAAAGAAEIPQPERDFGPERLDAPKQTEDVVGRLEGWLARYRDGVPEKYRDRPIVVRVHPLLEGHLRRGFPSLATRWRFRLRGLRFALEADPALHPLDFEVRDGKSGKPLTSQYEPAPPTPPA